MLEPQPGKIAVIPMFDPDMTASGLLYVPEQAKERSDQGIVKYIGKDCKLVKPGDLVLFSGYSGTNLRVDNELLIVLDEESVVAVLEGEDLDTTEIEGLFFRGKDGTFFKANYEFAMELISRAINDAEWRRGLKSKDMVTHRNG